MELKAPLQDWLSLRPALVHIYRGEVAAGGRDTHVLPGGNHFAWLLEQGSVTVTQGSRITRASKGEWLIANPGTRHQKFSPDARIISVHFQAKWPDGCDLFEEGLSIAFSSKKYPCLKIEAERLLKSVREVLPSDPVQIRKTPLSIAQYMTMQHLGTGFLAALVDALLDTGLAPSRVGHTDERLLQALRQLDHHPVHLPLNEISLARASGITRGHLSTRFKTAFGISPGQYFDNRRQDYARRMLGHSAVPVKEIAGNLGFSSLADFSAWFKRRHHVSPRHYRKSVTDSGYL